MLQHDIKIMFIQWSKKVHQPGSSCTADLIKRPHMIFSTDHLQPLIKKNAGQMGYRILFRFWVSSRSFQLMEVVAEGEWFFKVFRGKSAATLLPVLWDCSHLQAITHPKAHMLRMDLDSLFELAARMKRSLYWPYNPPHQPCHHSNSTPSLKFEIDHVHLTAMWTHFSPWHSGCVPSQVPLAKQLLSGEPFSV